MFYSDIKKIIEAFADEVQMKQIKCKCRLNNQIKSLSGVLETMIFRKKLGPEIRYHPTPEVCDLIWKAGINTGRKAPTYCPQYAPTHEQLFCFPGL